MNPLGNPARDIILAADERHLAAMERGSLRLRFAIEELRASHSRRPILRTQTGRFTKVGRV